MLQLYRGYVVLSFENHLKFANFNEFAERPESATWAK